MRAFAPVTLAAFLCLSIPPLLGAGAGGEGAVGGETKEPRSVLDRGWEVYAQNCAGCHGTEGKGDGPAAPYLYPKPRDFTSGAFRVTSTPTGSLPTDEDLFRVITEGMPGSAMPSWELLPENDRWALVAFMKTLAKFWDEDEEAWVQIWDLGLDMTPVAVPPPPPRTSEAIARGRHVYRRADCAKCHGDEGRGAGSSAAELRDSAGWPIRARDLTAGIFKGGADPVDVYRRISIGMNGTPMPSFAATLSPAERWDLTYYLLSLARPGAYEMVKQTRRTIVAQRVAASDAWSDPASAAWAAQAPVYVALMPLWWRDRRIEGLLVRAVHDGTRIHVHLSWEDETADTTAARSQDFRDGVAVQLARSPAAPFIAMGAGVEDVNIWMWKADRQRGVEGRPDVETQYPNLHVMDYPETDGWKPGTFDAERRTLADLGPGLAAGWAAGNPVSDPNPSSPVENLVARGFSTLRPLPRVSTTVEGKGVHDRGIWSVVLSRAFADSDAGNAPLAPGQRVPAAFACWDGSAGDRNGQKQITIWHDLEIAW